MNSRKPSRVLAVALMAMLLGVGGLASAPTAVAAPSTDADDRAFFCDFRNQGLDDEGVGPTIAGDVATWWATYGPEDGVDCFDLEVTVSCGQIDATLTSYIILKDGTTVDRVWWSEGGVSSYAFPKTFAEDYNGGSVDVTIAFNTPENQAIIGMDPSDEDHWIGTGGRVYTVDTDCLAEGEDAKLNVIKFYDADANGEFDDGEQLIEGWKISVNGNDFFTPYSEFVDPGDYEVAEYMPVEPNWMATTPSPVNVTLAAGEEKTVEFGNVCVGAGGGKTLGFWSNKNGKAVMKDGGSFASELDMLEALHLRNANGTDFNPITYKAFNSWLLEGHRHQHGVHALRAARGNGPQCRGRLR